MKDFSTWIKSENFSIDWVQGIVCCDSFIDVISALMQVGFDADQWVYDMDLNTRFYRDTFYYAPAGCDISIQYNALRYTSTTSEDQYYWIDNKGRYHHFGFTTNNKDKARVFQFSCPDFLHINDERYNQHYFIRVTGDGLRYLRQKGLYKPFFKVLRGLNFRCSRIDIAFDIYERDNMIVDLLNTAFRFTPGESDIMVTTRMQRCKNVKLWENVYDDRPSSLGFEFGNHGSNMGMLRLYDKLHECLYGRNSVVTAETVKDLDYWYRFEIEMHNEFAETIFNNVVDKYDFGLGPAFAICSSLFFKVRYANWNDKTVSRYELHDVYELFLTYIIQNIDFV